MKRAYLLQFLSALFFLCSVVSALGANPDYCWKDSYGRGVGTIPTGCDSGKVNQTGLCYTPCRTGYSMQGPVCWQGCPSGYVDTGMLCHINKSLTASGSWRCTERDYFGTCWWSVLDCPSGYTNAGLFCALNTPSVPAGYNGLTGLDILKNTYGNGVGTIPSSCGSGSQNDTGLCYKNCNAGYSGIGPVCWNSCPSGMSKCGAGCAKDATTCATVTTEQVTAALGVIASVATAGAAAYAEHAVSGLSDAEKAAKVAKDASDTKSAWNIIKNSAAVKKMRSLNDIKNDLKNATVEERAYYQSSVAMDKVSTSTSPEDTSRAIANLAAVVDPTGIASAVGAYTYPVCNH